MEEKNTRRQVLVTLTVTTLVFFALLAGALLLHRQLQLAGHQLQAWPL